MKGDAVPQPDDRHIQAVIFDLDNTLTDFMKAKENSITAAVDAMIDVGLPLSREAAIEKIFAIYKAKGIEHQRVFNIFLEQTVGTVEHRMLAAGVVAYRRGREGSLVPYPHAKLSTPTPLGLRMRSLAHVSRDRRTASRLDVEVVSLGLRIHVSPDPIPRGFCTRQPGKIRPG